MKKVILLLSLIVLGVSADAQLTEGGLQWAIKQAKRGSMAFQDDVAKHYEYHKDYAQAIYWYKMAAAPRKNDPYGSTTANIALGKFYYEGIHVPKDYSKAVEHFRRAGGFGSAYLGRCYYYGHGVPQDKTKGLELARQGASPSYDTGFNESKLIYSILLKDYYGN